jgi:hypothetical protein
MLCPKCRGEETGVSDAVGGTRARSQAWITEGRVGKHRPQVMINP